MKETPEKRLPWATRRSSRRHERIIQIALLCCAAMSVFTTAGIICVLLGNAVYAPGAGTAFFERISIREFLTETRWKTVEGPGGHFGILPLLSGTLMVGLIASAVSIPAGLGAAVYMSEYAAPKERNMIKPVLEVLGRYPHRRLRILCPQGDHSMGPETSLSGLAGDSC